MPIVVGPFELGELLGVGGMGEVWRATHRVQKVEVAVKVITAMRARDQRFREAFQNEVRAVAGLDHPGIVHVFDYGEVDGPAAAASLDRLVAGSPYLAMEMAEGGSLRTRPMPRTWGQLRELLLWLLDVLAHAHARGVIHRDIKPGNVLVFGPDNPDEVPSPHQLRLTDFGLAHATDRGEKAMRGTSGTPTYMAPEQFLGHWRDFGPWTDLYAVGCMAYAMSTGSPPFRSGGLAGLRQAHISADPAPMRPTLALPADFESWVLRLMDKDIRMRFQTAADAAHALQLLGEPEGEPIAQPFQTTGPDNLPSRFTLDHDWSELVSTAVTDVDGEPPVVEPEPLPEPRFTDHLYPRRMPPLPPSWRMRTAPKMSMRLVGAGLGLYGLRTIPLVGREQERDLLWAALHRTRSTRRTQLVALRGAAGRGKTRMAQWMCRRAAELGSAVVLHTEHSEGGGPQDGIAQLVTRALGGVGMPRNKLLKRAQTWLQRRGVVDPREARALTELVWPTGNDGEDNEDGDVATPTERFALISRLFHHLAQGLDAPDGGPPPLRPIVLLLDDLQWASEAFGLARFLLGQPAGEGPPVLLLATLRDDVLESLPATRAEVNSLLSHPRAQTIDVAPLDRDNTRNLVRELLSLEPQLARQVEERTDGNPLFAVQLVGDWVQRGVLEVSGNGFTLRRGEEAVLPDDIHALWAERIERVLAPFFDSARMALEIAGLLGTQIDDAEWRGACSVARIEVPPGLVPAMVERGLASMDSAGWSFAHGMLRESLVRQAEEGGRAARLHDAAATTLQIRFAVARQPGLAERLSRHLIAAGRFNEALRPLYEAAHERRTISSYSEALDLLEQYEQLLAKVGVGPSDARWGTAWGDRADLLISNGRLAEAETLATQIAEVGQEQDWGSQVAAAWCRLATVSLKAGDLAEARTRLREADAAARNARDRRTQATTQLLFGDLARMSGEPRDALHFAREALRTYTAIGDAKGRADALAAEASATRMLADLDRTERYARQAIPLYKRVGSRFGVASCQNLLGEVLRERGDLDGASDAYAQAESLLRRMGSSEQLVPQINGGLVAIAREDYEGAQRALERALPRVTDDGRRALQGALHAFLLPCAAAARDWTAWRRHLKQAQTLLAATGFIDADVAWTAERGAQLAHDLGYIPHAIEAYELAHQHYAGVQDRDGVVRVRELITALRKRRRG